MFELAKLYKRSKNGKISEWKIWVEQDNNNVPVIFRESGFIGFKHKTNKRYIKKGTNIGKSNEKSSLENAKFIANNYWKKHIEDNYVDDVDDVDLPPKYLKPMLAKTFRPKDNIIGKIAQPKYNGIRAVSFRHIGDTDILSRERKVFDTLDHIKKHIDDIFGEYSPDGEIYHHDLTFQEIVRRVKKYREGLTEELEYWVYDLAIPDKTFEERYKILNELVPDNHPVIKKVPIRLIANTNDFKVIHGVFVGDGYEGIIIRSPDSFYGFNDRPVCLQKYKEFIDEEFKIVGFQCEEYFDESANKIRKLVIWVCKTLSGEIFNTRSKGSFDARERQYNDAKNIIDKNLTVRYQELSENGVPIFPVGICIRDYE